MVVVGRRGPLSGCRVSVALVQEFDTLHIDLGLGIGLEDCQRWTREPGESKQDFSDRVK